MAQAQNPALARRLGETMDGEVAFDAGTRALYSMDASNYRRVPVGVAFPRSADDVIAAVAACREEGVAVVPRGGGTSVAGNAIGTGLVIDASRHFGAILGIDPDTRTARVQPGVVLDDLQAAAAPYGLCFAPDPSTHSRCTIGGMIGNNACGAHSVAWGTTADNVESLELLRYDGTRVTAARGLDGPLQALVDDDLATIRRGLPPFPRRVSGYALDRLLPENGGDLAAALVGTEGTCGTVLEATLRLVPLPRVKGLVVLGYADDVAAAEAAPGVLPHGPLTVEGMDRGIPQIWLSQQTRGHGAELPEAGAWLFVEVGGENADEVAARAHEIVAGVEHRSARIVADPAEQRTLWRIREEGAGLATRLPGGGEAWPGWEDSAVPPERLGAYLRDFKTLLKEHGRQGLTFGHFGEGCLHVRIDLPLTRAEGVPEFRRFIEAAADLVVSHGGSPSGEHGDGRARSELLTRMYGPEVVRLFERFKAYWDPDDRMNPGVIVRPKSIDDDLRLTLLPAGREPATAFAYRSDAGSFTQAARRCVGVGKCRADHGGVMCPSYRVTRDERHSTRGRAHLLFEMLSGDVITDGWRSEEVRDALDLCLSCRGCHSDCPVEVDMATYKAEFLHRHYQGRLRPAAHYSMGWLPLWARLAAPAAGAVNAVTGSAAAGLLKRLGGIASERSIPRFARTPLRRALRGRRPRPGGRPVLLWPDTFTNHFDPQVGLAAIDVLESAGLRPVLPRGSVCCGLTWISTGQLGVAKRVIRRTLRTVRPYLDAGLPVVGLEPSCAAALRTDLPELAEGPDRATADLLAARTHTFATALEAFAPDWSPPLVAAESITQMHCHQHAELGFVSEERLLARAGVDNRTLDSGCCGLAGNFGFERGHYDVSMACAEAALLPAVREAAPGTLVVADGFSCRTQVHQATGRRPVHLAEVLARSPRAPRTN